MMKLKETLAREIFENEVPFNRFLGIRIVSMERGRVRVVLPYREEFIGDRRRPALHGGVISTLIDAAAGAAAFTELGDSDRLSTIDLVVDYLLPATLDTLEADAKIVRIGNRVAVAEVRVHQAGKEEIIAQGRAVYGIVRDKRITG